MRVEPVWADEREGSHHRPRPLDACRRGRRPDDRDLPPGSPRRASSRCVAVRTPAARLEFTYRRRQASSRFLQGIAQRKIIGAAGRARQQGLRAAPRRRPRARAAHHRAGRGRPPRHRHLVLRGERAFYGGTMEIPYTTALILLDGADLSIMHLIQECPVDQVRIGMRVEAVWVRRRRARPDPGVDQVVPPHRRARRRRPHPRRGPRHLARLRGVSTGARARRIMRDVAIIGFAQTPARAPAAPTSTRSRC